MNEHLVVLVAAPSLNEARRLARRLLNKKLAVGVNFVHVESMSVWHGAIHEEEEILMVIKTRGEAFDELATIIKTFHPNETPEILALPITQGSHEYLDWINNELSI